ncbi:hypothetical protein IID21_05130 [Patescibacteria group bacterium]|nr:hypothetical protein [Patescibacteria group bacterium]
MSLLQEARQRSLENEQKLAEVETLRGRTASLLAQKGEKDARLPNYRSLALEVPTAHGSVDVEIHSYDSNNGVTISLEGLSKRISLGGLDTRIFDRSVSPESVKTLHQITPEDFMEWEKVITAVESALTS